MAYINPAELMGDYFRSPVDKGLSILPSLMANKRQQEELRLRQEEAERAKKAYADLMSGGVSGLSSILPEGLTPEKYVSGVQSGILKPLTPTSRDTTKSQIVGNQMVTFDPSATNVRTQIIPGLQPPAERTKVIPLRDKDGNLYKSHQKMQLDPQSNSYVWVEEAQEPIQQIQTPEQKIEFEVKKQNALRPGILQTEKESKPTFAQQANIPFELENNLYTITHDKQGNEILPDSMTINALKLKANAWGFDIIQTQEGIEEKKPWFGFNTKAQAPKFIIVPINNASIGQSSPVITPSVQDQITLPPTIKTTSQAVQYLMQNGMTQEQAVQWIRDNN